MDVSTQTETPTSDPLLGAQPVMVSPAQVTYVQPAAVQHLNVRQTAPAQQKNTMDVSTQTETPTSDPLLGAQPVMVSPAQVTYVQPAAVQHLNVRQTAPAQQKNTMDVSTQTETPTSDPLLGAQPVMVSPAQVTYVQPAAVQHLNVRQTAPAQQKNTMDVSTQTETPTSDPLLGAQPVMVSPAQVTYVQPAAVQHLNVRQTAPAQQKNTMDVSTQTETPTSDPLLGAQPVMVSPAQVTYVQPAAVQHLNVRQTAPAQSRQATVTASPVDTSSGSTPLRSQKSDTNSEPPSKRALQLCTYCNTAFPENIIDHHVGLHLRQSFMTCLDCDKNFRSQEAMDKHRCS